MSTIQEQIKAARGLLRGFEGLAAVADALESVASAEERLYSINGEIAKAVDRRQEAESAAKVAADNLAEVTAQVEAARMQRIAASDGAAQEAEQRASAIVTQARTEADQIVYTAKEKAAAAKVKADAKLAELAEMETLVAAKTAELKALQDSIDEIRAKLLG